jgi:tetratricopeptide (TPR) repeat protein
MKPARVSPWRAALSVACLAGLMGSAAGADFKDAYKSGVEAAKRKDWAATERLMSTAIGERPQEALRLTALFFRNYLPHYYLGLAHFEQGDCRAALEAWETSVSQGAVQKATEEWSTLQAKRKNCQQRLADVEQAARDGERGVAAAKELMGRVAAAARSSELGAVWNSGEPSFAARQRRSADEIKQAEGKIQSGSQKLSLGEVREATDLAAHAAADLQNLLSDVGRRRDEVRSQIAARRGALDVKIADAQRALQAAARISPQPASVAQQRAAIETLLRQASSLAETPDLAEVDNLTTQIEKATAKLRRLGEPPPDLLASAIDAYLSGDHRGVLAQLAGADVRDPRTHAQVCLLRAAAGFALYMVGGEKDAEQLANARAAVSECKGLGGSAPKPSTKLFSPRFLDFWNQ